MHEKSLKSKNCRLWCWARKFKVGIGI